ncbi:hypothetical protein FGG08_002742 [Glutinoglossum americanum]|uniref:Uncharacterized protein n=1 Tax=Glutinoglossum americanum TaxID=1670608 RepID=A0A9P8I8M3_9PEZI|nr:hypothetical protein FGG08_002742 [Glutinoglossum americanum]
MSVSNIAPVISYLHRQPSRNLTLEPNPTLSSNNPFRNRAASPAPFGTLPSPISPVFNGRPVSRNPFLDVFDENDHNGALVEPKSPHKSMSFSDGHPQADPHSGHAAELFNNLTLEDRPSDSGPQQLPGSMGRNRTSVGPRFNNLQNNQVHKPSGGHRTTKSQEDEGRRISGLPPRSDKQPELNIFADPFEPPKSRDRRQRRNSESSIMENRGGKLDSDEERRRRRERRLREGRNPDGGRRDGHRHGSSKPRRPNHRLDLIDKLDVTSIYGTGLFHHDGPFDACNPHRNRNSRRAPMQAFPKGSANNSIGGAPIDPKSVDHSQYYGNRDAEAFTDYSASGAEPQNYGYEGRAFNATMRVDPVHGDETLGLGTSTFLEGAPASRTAMQRRESETETSLKAGGLQRKKSLAQKIKGISTTRPGAGPSGRVVSPEPMFEVGTALTTKDGQEAAFSPVSSGGVKKANENNPFFNTHDSAWDKKGESIATADQEKTGRNRAPSSPRRGLERRLTAENGVSPDGIGKGLLQRVKSLKGGARRARPSEKSQT